MLATIIEIDIPKQKVDVVRERIARCVEETGDELIGYQSFEDGSMKLVVKLKRNDYIPKHQIVLGPALQAGAISSFTFRTCALVKLLFEDVVKVKRLQTFPLREKEEWFMAVQEPTSAYLALSTSMLDKEQSQWIFNTTCDMQQNLSTEGIPYDSMQ